MSDEQDAAEALDDDKFGGQYPPDKLLGAQAYGAAGAEPHAPESVVARAAREESDDRPPAADDEAVPDEGTLVEAVVQEREAPRPAEEAALHVSGDGAEGPDEGGPVDDGDSTAEGAPSEPPS